MTQNGQNEFLKFLQTSKNTLLVKDSAGKAKPSTRNLPVEGHAYGKKPNPDKEGVGALISSWDVHKGSSVSKFDKDFKKINALCVSEGACTAAQQNKFRQSTGIRIKNSIIKEKFKIPNIVFGIPNKPSTPIKAVITNFFGENAAENMYDGFLPNKPSSSINYAKTTRGNKIRTEAIKNTLKNQCRSSNIFKLKKFVNVQAKTETRRKA